MKAALVWAIGIGMVATVHAKDITVKRVSVVDEVGRGVPAEIRTMDLKDQEGHFIYTDDSGVARPNKACAAGMRLIAKPRVDSVYEKDTRPPYCKEEVKVTLKMSNVKYILFRKADFAARRGEYGTAAALYMETAARMAGTDPDEAKKAESKAYSALQSSFGKKMVVFDPDQEKNVLTMEGIQVLKAYQADNDLPVTGKFDWFTATKISPEEPFKFVKEAYGKAAKETAAVGSTR